tara:strand:- start:73241 stop:73693 length:453 start_codon:yes stop_codon:yes gene_type:complete
MRPRTLSFAALASAAILTCSCVANIGSNRPGPADADAPQEFTQTASGLKYRILRKSDGRKPTASDLVKVHYAGWLDDTTEFDSSYSRGAPADFALSSVIPAWTEGVQLIGEGGMIELEVPPELGYGAAGAPPKIPPNATLHFKVELLEVR